MPFFLSIQQTRRFRLLFLAATFVGLFLFSVYCSHDYLDGETVSYLITNLRPVGFLNNVFNFKSHDFGVFRARELSYAFNIVDSYFVRAGFSWGVPHYLSLVHYIAVLLVSCLQLTWAKKYLRISWWQNTLLVLLFLSSPITVLSGFHFRTSKVLVGLGAWALAWLFYFAVKTPAEAGRLPKPVLGSVLVTALTLAMTLFDEQGVFLAGYFLMISALWSLLAPNRYTVAFFIGTLLAVALHFLYRFAMAPFLFEFFTGGSFSLGKTTPTPTLADLKAFRAEKGFSLAWLYFLFSYGGTLVIAAPTAILLFWGATKRFAFSDGQFANGSWNSRLPALTFWATLLAFIVANGLMLTRHTIMLWGMVTRVYYGIPATMLMLAGAAFVISRIIENRPSYSRAITVLLAVCLVGNLVALPGHNRVRRTEFEQIHYRSYEHLGNAVKACVLQSSQEPMPADAVWLCELWKSK
jgi:hypothetical protein